MKSLRGLIKNILSEIELNSLEETQVIKSDYPEFQDGQANPIFHNKAYPPKMHMNTSPLGESEISQEELDKKLLPIEYHYMFDDFVTYTTEAELREIAPAIDLNRNTKDIVLDIKKNYPSIYDNFAKFISDRLK